MNKFNDILELHVYSHGLLNSLLHIIFFKP